MNKLICLIFAFLSGCAHISEYNQGCRDGIASVNVNSQGPLGRSKSIDQYCDGLDAMHRAEKEHGKHP